MEKLSRSELEELWRGRYVENYPQEMFPLIEKVEGLNPLRIIIEIGVNNCGTLRLWERLVPPGEGLVIGVDISPRQDLLRVSGRSTNSPQLPMGGTAATTFWNTTPSSWVDWTTCTDGCFVPEESDRQVHLVSGDSTSEYVHDSVANILGDRKADFIFHDGDHLGEVPCKDFVNIVEPFLRQGGMFALADVGTIPESGQGLSGTVALYQELSSKIGRNLPLIEPRMAGIALWHKS